jgi:Domain of unknown function (DUF4376)
MNTLVYSFDIASGKYTGIGVEDASNSPASRVDLTYAVPPARTANQTPHYIDGAWVLIDNDVGYQPPALTLTQLRAVKTEQINQRRLHENETFFVFAGKQIACDRLSRSDIDATNGYVANSGTLPPGWPSGWKAMDNTYVAISDAFTWKQFYAAMVSKGMQNFSISQTLKAALNAATTPQAIDAIAWPSA